MFNSKKGIDDKVSNKLTTLSSQSLIKGDCSIDGDMRIDGTVERKYPVYRKNSHRSGRKNTRQPVLYTRLPSRNYHR